MGAHPIHFGSTAVFGQSLMQILQFKSKDGYIVIFPLGMIGYAIMCSTNRPFT